MRFSLVHPSRQRLFRADEAIREWRSQASGAHDIQHILSVDDSDPALRGYRGLAAAHGVTLVVGPNRTMVEAANRGAAAAAGDVLIVVSDDFGCPEAWDRELAHVIGGTREAAVWVHDGLEARILTLPVLTRALYERLGYVCHPAYRSVFADDDLTETARRAGALIDARHLRFPHRHFIAGLSPFDETYRRQNSDRAWWHGWGTFQCRGADAFGDPRTDLPSRRRKAGIRTYCHVRLAGRLSRRRWLPLLPGRARGLERRARAVFLRVLSQLTGVRGPD